MSENGWLEETARGIPIFRPAIAPPRTLIAFSGRGVAPEDTDSPTAFLARRFAAALAYPDLPIARATQVHGARYANVEKAPAPGRVIDAGQCDILVTQRPGLALVVQTADCVPIVFSSQQAVAVAHAGWRGSAGDVAGEAVKALASLGVLSFEMRVWLGPSIRACCYEVGGEVAAQFDGKFARTSPDGKFHLDLASINMAQLETAGIPRESISVHPGCTKCGGANFASWRRDGEAAGRMIALVARMERDSQGEPARPKDHAGVKSA